MGCSLVCKNPSVSQRTDCRRGSWKQPPGGWFLEKRKGAWKRCAGSDAAGRIRPSLTDKLLLCTSRGMQWRELSVGDGSRQLTGFTAVICTCLVGVVLIAVFPCAQGEVTGDKAHFLVGEVTLIPLSHQGQTLCSFCSEDWQCPGLVLPRLEDAAFPFLPPLFFVFIFGCFVFFFHSVFPFFSLLLFSPWVLTLPGGGCNRAQCKPFLCLCALLTEQRKRGNLTEQTQLGSVCILQTVWSICHGRGTSCSPAPTLCLCPGPAKGLQGTR